MTTIFESIRIGLGQIWGNKLRSFLSVVGILIAVGAVTGVVSIGEGLRVVISREFEDMGGPSLMWSWAPETWYRGENGQWMRHAWEEHITFSDIEAMKEASDHILAVVPNLGMSSNSQSVTHLDVDIYPNVQSTTPELLMVENIRIERGRFLTDHDMQNRSKVCILSYTVAEDLFAEDDDPLGQEIKIYGVRYTVVGVLEAKDFFGHDYDTVIIPITTAQQRWYGIDWVGHIQVLADSPLLVPEVERTVRRIYRRHHEHGDEFNIRTGLDAWSEIERVIMVMNTVAGGIAGISLLVGGIGIMNIMLVSVTERTREIGVRKALGATRDAILLQFMVEAVVLCLFGGVLGLMFGIGIGQAIAGLINNLTGMDFVSVVSRDMMMFAVVFSTFVGVVFGVYPAWSGAGLDPVDALRHE